MAKGKYQKWLEPDGLLLLQAWARDGLTDEQIAHNMGIRRSTLADWKNKFSDISDALKKGKEIVDVEVENALRKQAQQALNRYMPPARPFKLPAGQPLSIRLTTNSPHLKCDSV